MSAPLKISETLALLDAARRALDEPTTDHGIAADPALPRCFECKQPITCAPLSGSIRGAPAFAHPECWETVKRAAADQVRFARGRAEGFLQALPVFGVAHDAQEFDARVRHPRARSAATRYQPGHGNLALIGPSGCGKTTAADAIARRLCDEAVAAYRSSGGRETALLDRMARARWTTAAALCVARKHHRLGEGESPEFERAAGAPLLFLDEIGQEIADDRWLLEFLDLRMVRGLSTITTSGLTRAQLEGRYGSGTYRRLIEPRGVCIDWFEEARPRLVEPVGKVSAGG